MKKKNNNNLLFLNLFFILIFLVFIFFPLYFLEHQLFQLLQNKKIFIGNIIKAILHVITIIKNNYYYIK